MEDRLLKYQIPHFYQLEEILRVRNCALDASDTGTGKTYVAIAIAHILGKKPFIICPKAVIPNWVNVAKEIGVELFGIANYEMIKGCKYYTAKLEKVSCPYIDKYKILDPRDKNKDESKRKEAEDFKFSLPSDVIVIMDEAHRCKNHKTISSRLMLSIFRSGCKILLLSATISDKIECFKPFGVVFGFYDETKKFNMWLRKIKKSQQLFYKDKQLNDEQISLDIIHHKMFPEYGSRMKIKDLGSMFPSNQVLSQSYMSNNKEEIQQQYEIIQDAFQDLKVKETRSEGLGKLIRARMKIEMLKVPIMLDIIEEALDSNYSVAIFVNYKETLYSLAYYFETECLIHGDQTMEDRQDSIDKFQSNKSKIIICITQAGGVGISLHDIHGGHPRMSVISPTWSGQDTQQVLGRIHRAGSKSPALQRIVFVSGTYEETICQLIQKKLTNISAINDRDLIGPKFTEEEYEEATKNMDTLNYGSNEIKVSENENSEHIKKKSENIKKDNDEVVDTLDNKINNDKSDIVKVVRIGRNDKQFKRIVEKKDKRLYVKRVDKTAKKEVK